MGIRVAAWGIDRLDDLTMLVTRALPDEDLSNDELRSCCWDEPGVVLGADDGSGVVAVAVEGTVASIKLLAIDPRAGFGTTGLVLVDAAQAWADHEGADELRFGGPTPPHLWPGIDTANRELVHMVESAGFEDQGRWTNAQVPTSFRSAPPPGVVIARVLDDDRIDEVCQLTERWWPSWLPGVERAVEGGTCLEARASDDTVGLICHSVSRVGWIGPLGVDPAYQRLGIGRALLGDACRDLMIAGYSRAELSPPDAWTTQPESWPLAFFTKAGATPSRSYRLCRRSL